MTKKAAGSIFCLAAWAALWALMGWVASRNPPKYGLPAVMDEARAGDVPVYVERERVEIPIIIKEQDNGRDQ